MSATLVSPPPQTTPPDQSIHSSPSLHLQGSCFMAPGRRSVLPRPSTHAGSPPARSSSPRRHLTSAVAATAATPINLVSSSPAPRQNPAAIDRLPSIWGEDTVHRNHVNSLPNPFDHFLDPLPESELGLPSDTHRMPTTTTDAFDAGIARPFRAHNMPPAGPSRSETQLTGTTLDDSLNTQFSDDLFVDDLDLIPQSSQSSVSDAMPTTRKRNAPARRETSPMNKRLRTDATGPEEPPLNQTDLSGQQYPPLTELDDDLFGDIFQDVDNLDTAVPPQDLQTIDLTEANEVPAELHEPEEPEKPEEDTRIKIRAFQCVICMDNVTTLTVTHCGHMYCAQCLHSSLNVEATKGKCPMCRSKIDIKPRTEYTNKTKGYWPLELKLMTKTKLGKRKAGSVT